MKTLMSYTFLLLLAAVATSAGVPPSLRESPQAYFSELVQRGKIMRTEGHKKVAQEVFAHLLQNLNTGADGAEGDVLQISGVLGNLTISEIGPLQEILDPNIPRSQKMYHTTANLRGARAPSLTIPINIFIPLLEDELGRWNSIQAVEFRMSGFTSPDDFSSVGHTFKNLEVAKNLFSSGESLRTAFRSGAFVITPKTLMGVDVMRLHVTFPRLFGIEEKFAWVAKHRPLTFPEALERAQRRQVSLVVTCKEAKDPKFPLYAILSRSISEPRITLEKQTGNQAIDAFADFVIFDHRWSEYLRPGHDIMLVTSCEDLAEKVFHIKTDLPAFLQSAFSNSPKPSLEVGYDEY